MLWPENVLILVYKEFKYLQTHRSLLGETAMALRLLQENVCLTLRIVADLSKGN